MNGNSAENDLITLIILGRGGQGAVTACEIIAEAAYMSGNFIDVHAYPSFGAERRGAPVQAYAKLSRKHKIWESLKPRKLSFVFMDFFAILSFSLFFL